MPTGIVIMSIIEVCLCVCVCGGVGGWVGSDAADTDERREVDPARPRAPVDLAAAVEGDEGVYLRSQQPLQLCKHPWQRALGGGVAQGAAALQLDPRRRKCNTGARQRQQLSAHGRGSWGSLAAPPRRCPGWGRE